MSYTPMLTAQALAEHLARPVAWVQDQARAGSIPAAKVGREWRFDLHEIEAWKQRHHNVDPLTPTDLSRKRQASKRRSA